MKKTLFSLALVGTLAASLNAQNLEFRYYFQDSWNFNLAYKNYNNKDDLVFSGEILYEDYGLNGNSDAYNLILRGLVGKNLYLKQDGNSTFGVNLLGGLEYWRIHGEEPGYTVNKNIFGPMATLNISGVYDKNIIYDVDLTYITNFGDFKGHSVSYKFGAGYKFTENFYAKANVTFLTMGDKEKNEPAKTTLGFTLGYEF